MSLILPHHDGSPLYVSDPAPGLGDEVAVFVRVPRASGVRQVRLRTTPDAEPGFAEAQIDRQDDHEVWYRASVKVRNPVAGYRFLLLGARGDQRWLNASGVHDRDVTDTADFRLVADHGAPDWVADAILYQVFPDRFAHSGATRELPPWLAPADWEDEPIRGGMDAMRQFYGGDLPGVEQHLDHLVDLGVTGVYLNPIFPAPEHHRYCASSFDEVDPLLGGDAALASLAAAMHVRGLRLVGDLTANHSGDTHPWFQRAVAEPDAVERGFYHWIEYPDVYESWAGVKSLPKFDHRNPELRRRLYEGAGSVVARWMEPPFELDGWRVDAANMAGRCGPVDETLAMARRIRATMEAVRGPRQAYLLAEHCHHAAPDLDQGGWHGTMNYPGFTLPAWSWLRDPQVSAHLLGLPFGPAHRPAEQILGTYLDTNAEFSWATRLASLNPLGSHDTGRFRTVAGDDGRFRVGVALLLTLPGVPSILYGDEVGLRGADDDDARRPMPWDRGRWDRGVQDWYRTLIRLRRDHDALRRGGLRFVTASGDVLTYLRETPGERLLVHLARAASRSVLPTGLLTDSVEPVSLVSHDLALTRHPEGHQVVTDGPGVGIWRL